MDAVAVANCKEGKTLIFLIPGGCLLLGLLLESLQFLMKVSNRFCILFLLLVVDPVPLSDGLYEGLSKAAEPNQVVDVESLDEVSS